MQIVQETEGFVHKHPAGAAAIAFLVVLFLWWAFFSGSKTQAATVVQAAPADDTSAAAGLAAAQIAANAQTAQAQIAAGVANTATQSQLDAATVTSNNSTAVSLAQANATASIAQSQADAQVASTSNEAASNEFTSLAAALTQFGTTMTTSAGVGSNASFLASVLNTASNNSTNVQTTGLNDLTSVTNAEVASGNGDAPSRAALLSSYVTGLELNPYDADRLQVSPGATAGGTATTAGATGYSASDLATLFGGPSTTTALSGAQFSQDYAALTAQLGNGLTFHAQG